MANLIVGSSEWAESSATNFSVGSDVNMLIEDNGSVINGVVDDDFLMMLEDQSLSGKGGKDPYQLDININIGLNDSLGVDFNEDLSEDGNVDLPDTDTDNQAFISAGLGHGHDNDNHHHNDDHFQLPHGSLDHTYHQPQETSSFHGLNPSFHEQTSNSNSNTPFNSHNQNQIHQMQFPPHQTQTQQQLPQRGVPRYFSEGMSPISPTISHMSQLAPMQRQTQQTHSHQHPQAQQVQRGVARHYSERIPENEMLPTPTAPLLRGQHQHQHGHGPALHYPNFAQEPRRGVSRHMSERIPERIPEMTPSFYPNSNHQPRSSPPQSPIPNEINIFESNSMHERHDPLLGRAPPPFRVTPEHTNSAISLPDPYELQVQYQRTLQRLSKSMRLSDATRSIVKRHRSGFSACSNVSVESELSEHFYGGSTDQAQVEEARRRLYQLISGSNQG